MGDCSSPGLGNASMEEVAPSDCALVVIGFIDESVQGCIGASSSVGRRVIVGHFLLYQSSRLVMIMFAIGAGV
jgi:hypothetical protein